MGKRVFILFVVTVIFFIILDNCGCCKCRYCRCRCCCKNKVNVQPQNLVIVHAQSPPLGEVVIAEDVLEDNLEEGITIVDAILMDP